LLLHFFFRNMKPARKVTINRNGRNETKMAAMKRRKLKAEGINGGSMASMKIANEVMAWRRPASMKNHHGGRNKASKTMVASKVVAASKKNGKNLQQHQRAHLCALHRLRRLRLRTLCCCCRAVRVAFARCRASDRK